MVLFWDMPFLDNAPRVLSLLALLLAVVTIISSNHDLIETVLFLLVPLVLAYAAIIVLCAVLFRIDLLLFGFIILWCYDVFFVIFVYKK